MNKSDKPQAERAQSQQSENISISEILNKSRAICDDLKYETDEIYSDCVVALESIEEILGITSEGKNKEEELLSPNTAKFDTTNAVIGRITPYVNRTYELLRERRRCKLELRDRLTIINMYIKELS